MNTKIIKTGCFFDQSIILSETGPELIVKTYHRFDTRLWLRMLMKG